MIRKLIRPCAIALAVAALNIGATTPSIAAEASMIPAQVAATRMLDRKDAVLLLVDHQMGLFTGVRDIQVDELKRNVVTLAKAAQALDIPIVITNTMPDGAWGPAIPELRAALPNARIIVRTEINAWDNKEVSDAVRKTGRKQVLVAGVSTEVCAAFPALSAKAEGFDTRVVLDASGTFNDTKRTVALSRLAMAGVPITDVATSAVELLHSNTDPKAGEVYGILNIPFATLLYQLEGAKAEQVKAELSKAK
jgi:nicotinamidase-related amidase